MGRKSILQNLIRIGVVPVIRANSESSVLSAVEALMEGGIPVAEITMTIPNAIDAIKQCSKAFGDELVVGAGSVIDIETCSRAIDAGSKFVVTPAVRRDVIATCNEKNVCVIGGALTPSEILSEWEAGADVVKVFPVKALGGPAYIRMVREPLPHIPLVPTGGISLETLDEYFEAGASFVAVGGDLVNRGAIESGRVELIKERARQYISKMDRVRGKGPTP